MCEVIHRSVPSEPQLKLFAGCKHLQQGSVRLTLSLQWPLVVTLGETECFANVTDEWFRCNSVHGWLLNKKDSDRVYFCSFPSGREVESVGPLCAEMEALTACSTSPRILPDHLDEGGNRGSPIRRTDSPSKKKGISAPSTKTTKYYLELKMFKCISVIFFLCRPLMMPLIFY